MEKKQYDNYVKILRSELIPAMGCTEPIAIAYAAAKARQVLGVMPERMVARCSGNIIKNVKGVNVPNAGGQKGVQVAAILGALAGNPDLELQVISQVSEDAVEEVRRLNKARICTCELEEGVENLYIRIEAFAGEESAVVVIKTKHNHISLMEKNGQVLLKAEDIVTADSGDKSQLNLKDILEFAETCNLADVDDLITKQIEYNTAISNEGLTNGWGTEVGRILMESGSGSVSTRASARAAAGSDARMNGCAMPVVINAGSGNQGITCTMPVVTYAEELGVSTLTAARFPPVRLLPAALPICTVRPMMSLAAPSSTPWATPAALSAMAPRLPALPRSLPLWKQASWAMKCPSGARSLPSAKALWKVTTSRPSAILAAWQRKV